jgi:O-antigen/teichoic acid export membrane protein
MIMGSYNYSTQVVSFLATAILSRLLLPSEYGIVALITVFTGFVMIFTDAGLSFDIIRSDYKYTYHKSISNLSFVMGLGLFLLMCLLAYPIALFYDNMTLIVPTIVMSSLFLIRTITIVPTAILNKNLDFNYLGRVQFFSALVSILFMIVFAFLNFSYWSLIIPQLISSAYLYHFYSRKTGFPFRLYPYKYTVAGFRKAKSIMGHLTGFNVLNYWVSNADNLLIGKVYGEADLGIYNRAYRLLTLSYSLTSGLFGKVLYPSLKKLQSEGGSIQNEYLNVLGIISLLNYPIAFILIVFPETFVRILWGENWMGVAAFLPYFGIMVLTKTLTTTTGNIFILFRKENVLMYIGLVSSIITIGAIILGSLYSVIAIARFITLTSLTLTIPITLVYGFGKTFGFKPVHVIGFWLPKLVLSLVILFSTWTGNQILSVIAIVLYLFHLVYFQRNDLIKIYVFIKGKALSIIKSKF